MKGDCTTKNFQIPQRTKGYTKYQINQLIKDFILNPPDYPSIISAKLNDRIGLILSDVLHVSKTNFPEQRNPPESITDGTKSVTWLQDLHKIYTEIKLILYLGDPKVISSNFSFPANSVTVRVIKDPPGTTDDGMSLESGAILAQSTYNTTGFKILDVTLPEEDCTIYIGTTQNSGNSLGSTNRPQIIGMRMEFGL